MAPLLVDVNFGDTFSTLVSNLFGEVNKASTLTELKEIIKANELTIFQWRLKNRLDKSNRNIILKDSSSLKWILRDVVTLNKLLNSGYVKDNRWIDAVNILSQIFEADPNARNGDYHQRLAVAISLTFSTPVLSFASYDKESIDPFWRYFAIVKDYNAKKFFPIHAELCTWLLRYVVASWCEEEELEWARNNILPEFKNPDKVGEVTHKMMSYKESNYKGVSVHAGAPYYDNKPRTLQILHEYGAVCGGVSKFGVAMSQAFGLPACPIGQPGHCAFLWWREGNWTLSNGITGITESHTHSGIQWTWNKRCDYQLLFDKAQQDFQKYSYSEQLRWVASTLDDNGVLKLEALYYALDSCPYNYLVWRDLVRLASEHENDENLCAKSTEWYKEIAVRYDCFKEENISAFANVTASVTDRVKNIVDRSSGSEWYCKNKEGWIEIEFETLSTVSSIEIWWWGKSFAAKYQILAAGEDGEYIVVKSEEDASENPKKNSYNKWSKLSGWSLPTKKIKFLLSDGHLDPWGKNVWIGTRQVNVDGKPIPQESDFRPTTFLKHRIMKNFVDHPNIGRDLLCQFGVILSEECSVVASVPKNVYNITDGTGSEWYCKDEEAWIEMQFETMSTVSSIEIQWWGKSFAENYKILAAGEDGEYIVVKSEEDASENPKKNSYNKWSKLSGWSLPTKKLKLLLSDGHLDPWGKNVWIGIRQVNVKGHKLN